MKQIQYKLFLLLFFLVCFLQIYSQIKSIGTPIIKNYLPEEYNFGSQNWSIVQTKEGLMYFGNTDGLLEYDGTNWRRIEMPNKSAVRSLTIDDNGTVYVGAINEFGYLDTDSTGTTCYISLINKLSKENQNFSNVWRTFKIKEGIIFHSFKAAFLFKKGEITVFKPEKSFHLAFQVNEKYYAVQLGKGIYTIKNNELVLIDNTSEIINSAIFFMLPYNKNILIGTRFDGLYMYDGNNFTKWNTPINTFLNKKKITNACSINKNNYAVSTAYDGIVIFDKNGKIIQHINKENGLQNNAVWDIYTDKDKNLWLALNYGISYISISSPFTVYNETNKLSSTIYSLLFDKNILYAGTQSGLFYKKQNKNAIHKKETFKKIDKFETQIWGINKIKNKILCSSNTGLYTVADGHVEKINAGSNFTQSNFWKTIELKNHPNIIIACTRNGFLVFEIIDNNVVFRKLIKGFEKNVRFVEEDKNGYIWVSEITTGVFKIKFDENLDSVIENKLYTSKDGLPSNHKNIVFEIDNKLIIASENGFYHFNKNKDLFEPINEINKHFNNEHIEISNISSDYENKIWFCGTNLKDESIIGGVFSKNKNGVYSLKKNFLNILQNMNLQAIYTFDKENIFFATKKGIVHYNPENEKQNYSKKSFKVIIRKIEILSNNDSLIYGGSLYFNDKEKPKILEFKNNSIGFIYSALFFEMNDAVLYSTYLEGFDNTPTEWGKNIKKEYTNLSEGKYTFKVKAKNIFGVESEYGTYEFIILPPWYRTFWAYCLYLFLLILFIYITVKLNSQRLIKAKIRLEGIVKERIIEIIKQKEEIQTQADRLKLVNAELIKQKEEIQTQAEELLFTSNILEKQNTKLEFQHKQITDSVRYAKDIQQATLPLAYKIKQHFDIFILYRPKDIVSGDFYWFTVFDINISKEPEYIKFIAVVDCTGHGVPGAFMSMIGIQLLNKIVNEDKIIEPAEILLKLHKGITYALKQEKNDNHDGMDLCLCRIEKQKNDKTKITFAGAKRPLYYFEKTTNKLSRIKGDRKSIGGKKRGNTQKLFFTNKEIILQRGDMIYLTTDGYIDQNNKERQKIGSTKLKEIINNIANKSLVEQKQILEKELDNWQGKEKQRDDVLVFGVKL